MTAFSTAIERALSATFGSDVHLAAAPEPLTGGHSSQLFTLRLTDPPEHLASELVLRLPPGGDSRREQVIQQWVATQGYPAPAVLGMDPGRDNALGRPFLVMAKVPGTPLFVDAGPIEVWRAFKRVPELLANLMADLHELDPAPLEDVLADQRVGPDRLGSRPARLELDRAIEATNRPALGAIASWLDSNQPREDRSVVCHGDLHALNVLAADGDHTVIDWERATIAPAAYDVARTALMLSAVPVEMSRLARRFVSRLGRRSAAGFRRAYAERIQLASDAVSWHEVLHAGRLIARLTTRARETSPQPDPVLDAWAPTRPFLMARITELTGINLV